MQNGHPAVGAGFFAPAPVSPKTGEQEHRSLCTRLVGARFFAPAPGWSRARMAILNFQFFHRLPSSRKEATRERWIRRMMPTDSAITAIEISGATTKVNSR